MYDLKMETTDLIIQVGKWGVLWKRFPGVLGDACKDNFYQRNELLFTCAGCQKTLREYEQTHEPKCKVAMMQKLGM